MITKELVAAIQDFQTVYIQNICHWDLFDSFWGNVCDQYGGDDASLDFTDDIGIIWELIQPGFQKAYSEFKSELFTKFPELTDSGWDGEITFYTELWNVHSKKMFRNSDSYDFINLGESLDGGSYFFNMSGYDEGNTVMFSKKPDGKVVMTYVPYVWSELSEESSS